MAVRWTYGGRDYVIASNMLGELRCLDPRTGQPLWMQTGAGANQSTVAVGDNHLLGNVTPSSGEFTTLGAFRLDDKGATKVWQYPNGGKYSYVAILDKHAYINFERNNSGDQTGEGLHVLDLASGRVIKHHEIHLRSRAIVWAADGRVVLGHDGSHGLERYIMFGTAPDVQPYNIDWVGLPVPVGQGFIFSMSHAYVDGIVYLRGPDGVYALDMRAQ
jgi:outer membrane protein assembly factor BamB